MAQRWTGYTSGTERLVQQVESQKNRVQQLEMLGAQLKMQKKIADERNKTTLKAAEISQETQFGVTDKTQAGAKERVEITTGSQEKQTTEKEAGATTRTQMGITSAEKINTDRITSAEKINDAKILASKNELVMREAGLDSRLSSELSNRIDLRNLTDTAAMARLEKELGTRVDLEKMRQDGSLDRLVRSLKSNESIASLRESGQMDRLVKKLLSDKELAGLDNEQRMARLQEKISGDKDLTAFVQGEMNRRQVTGDNARLELTQFVQSEIMKRTGMELDSRETIQRMMEGGKDSRQQKEFLFQAGTQLADINAKMDRQIEGQKHKEGMQDKAFEQTKELSNINFEKEVLGNLLKMKMGQTEQQRNFNFLASPFSLGKTSNAFGMNYKESDVLNAVKGNLPALSEAVKIARELPKSTEIEEGDWYNPWSEDKTVTKLDPRAAALSAVLKNYEKELSGSQFYNWGESSTTKKQAKTALGDVQSLIQMLDMPSQNADFDSFLPQGY
tara:strand:- start:10450 stop:11961 length:1512 start_codon:yes stop_codon:yes gene_type:complete